jgi:conjugal transfer pilus assembly protein TraV
VNRSILAPSLLALSLSLTGCVTGGNIKGDFQCSAPGGTCAPMSTIDAAAISGIGSFRSIGEPGIEGQSVPRGIAGPVLADGTAPARTSDRVLRVVFPAHIDADGIYREQSAAHAVVENGAWAEALGGKPVNPRGVPALRAAGVVPASPTAASALATLDEIVTARAAQAGRNAPEPAPAIAITPTAYGAEPAAARFAAPLSLAEAASGLAAPRVRNLDPRAPTENFDTPYVLAARAMAATPASVSPARRVAPAPAATLAQAPSSVLPTAPYGSRTVRWKGKTYQLPYSNPQPTAAASAAPEAAQPDHTADLNKASLARVSQTSAVAAKAPAQPAYAITSDPQVAQARVQVMATPVMIGAIESGRDAAKAAAPAGFAVPLGALKDAPK